MLALNEHFAIGNFLSNGLQSEKIEVKGSPETTRSYMYPSDLVKILLLLPSRQSKGSLNIGSNDSITMSELATLISNLTSRKGIYFSNPKAEPSHYVPSIVNLERVLGGLQIYQIESILEKWIKWLRNRNLNY
jgi:dTDP-glucose 4,6-dehydratase